MKKFRKIIAMCLAAVMMLSLGCVGVFAENNTTDEFLIFETFLPEEGIMPTIDEYMHTTVEYGNNAGTNGKPLGRAFTIPSSHNTIKVTITGLGGIKSANISLWDAINNVPIRTYDYSGDSFVINGVVDSNFTYNTTDLTHDMTFVVKGSTYDNPNGGSVSIRVVSY